MSQPGLSHSSRAADFEVSDTELQAIIDRNVRKQFDIRGTEWQQERARVISNRTLGWRRWLRRLLASGRNARQQGEVRTEYETHWNQKDQLQRYLQSLDERTLCVEWRNQAMHLAPQALRQAHLLCLMRAISATKAASVLEVGFGNGNILLTLAARFPETRFAGVELTSSGLGIAGEAQALSELPKCFLDTSPEPLVDLTAHRRVNITKGDARALPFSDRSIDLVYTRLALEQMEAIRDAALSEITRVAARTLVLIEPWRDFNLKEPGRSYIRRQGYFSARSKDLERYGFKVILATDDIPQKVQFSAGPVVAVRV